MRSVVAMLVVSFLVGCGTPTSSELWVQQKDVLLYYPTPVQLAIILWWPILLACLALPTWAFFSNTR